MNFNDLIKANKQNVKNIIRLITKQDNEDLEQEVYIKAWKNASKYEERGSFKSWITTIAKNVSKDYLKLGVSTRLKLYNNARHELLNELEPVKSEVYNEIKSFITN